MAKKVGRPKNPRIKTLENKVEALLNKIEEMEQSKSMSIDAEALPCTGMGCVVKNGRYMMQVIKYDPTSKLAKVTEERDIGDANHRANFELNKFLTREFKFEEME